MRELVVVLSRGYEGSFGGLAGLRRRMFRLLVSRTRCCSSRLGALRLLDGLWSYAELGARFGPVFDSEGRL